MFAQSLCPLPLAPSAPGAEQQGAHSKSRQGSRETSLSPLLLS